MITRVLKAFLSLALLCTFTVNPLFAASKTVKTQVTLVSVELVENNHVGNEWVTASYLNGKEIEEGSTVELALKPTDTLKLKSQAEEQDKIPDIGTANTTIKVSAITKKITKSLDVTVVENRGRYSGKKAKWKFVFEIQKK